MTIGVVNVGSDGSSSGGGGNDFAVIQHQTAATVVGGGTTLGSWEIRPLTTEQEAQSWISVATNQFTISESGTYDFDEMYSITYDSGDHQAKIVQDPGGSPSDLSLGSSVRSDTADATTCTSILTPKRVVLTGSTVFQMESQVEASKASTGFGNPNAWGTNIYASVRITKVS